MKKIRSVAVVIQSLATKLGRTDLASFELISDGPNSWTIHDLHNDKLWKIVKPTRDENPYLEEEALDSLPENPLVVKHEATDILRIGEIDYRCLIFPYIHGVSLFNAIKSVRDGKREAFALDEVRLVAGKIAEAIAFLNQHGIIHQDIKPGNIVMQDDGSVKLIDLGIATFIDVDKKQLKTLQGPYAYLSPEKILVISNPSAKNWNQLTFASDLYSLGLVLFEMVTLTRLSDRLALGELPEAHTKLSELGVTEEFVRIIKPFILPSVYERQNEVEKLESRAWWSYCEPLSPRLWLHSSKNEVNIYPKFINAPASSPLGLLYQAEQVSSEKNIEEVIKRGQAFREKGYVFAFDPSTYIQFMPAAQQKGVRYMHYGNTMLEPVNFVAPSTLMAGFSKRYVASVIEQEQQVGADVLISPYFFVDRLTDHDWLDATIQVWKDTHDYIRNHPVDSTLYYGLFLSEELFKSKPEIQTLAVIISQVQFVKNLYLRIESKRLRSRPFSDQVHLENLRDFIAYVARSKNILLASSGAEGLGLLNYGLNAFSTNPEFSKRKFSMEDKQPRHGGQTPMPRLFSRRLLNELLLLQEVDKLLALGDARITELFECSCAYCPNRDPDSLKLHFLTNMDQMFSAILAAPLGASRGGLFASLLQAAKQGYAEISRHSEIELEDESSGTFLDTWTAVFTP